MSLNVEQKFIHSAIHSFTHWMNIYWTHIFPDLPCHTSLANDNKRNHPNDLLIKTQLLFMRQIICCRLLLSLDSGFLDFLILTIGYDRLKRTMAKNPNNLTGFYHDKSCKGNFAINPPFQKYWHSTSIENHRKLAYVFHPGRCLTWQHDNLFYPAKVHHTGQEPCSLLQYQKSHIKIWMSSFSWKSRSGNPQSTFSPVKKQLVLRKSCPLEIFTTVSATSYYIQIVFFSLSFPFFN